MGQSTREACTAVVHNLISKGVIANIPFCKREMHQNFQAGLNGSWYQCSLWWVAAGCFWSLRNSSELWFWSVSLRHDLGLTFPYSEKIQIPMQWCWSGLSWRSYPVSLLLFWSRDGEAGGTSSVSLEVGASKEEGLTLNLSKTKWNTVLGIHWMRRRGWGMN